MNVKLWVHSHTHGIKSYSPLLLNVSSCRNKMAFWRKICYFLSTEIFSGAFFSSRILRFSAGIHLSHPSNGGKKGRAYLLFLKKGRAPFWFLNKGKVHFWLFKKGQGSALSEKRKTWTLLIVMSVIVSYYFLIQLN